jgi:hypothetical protein
VTPTDDPQPDERKAAPDQQMLPERTLKLWLANFELTLTGQFSPEDVRDWYTGIGTLLVFVVVGTFASKVRAIDVDRGFYAMAAGAIPVLLVAFGIEQGIPSSSPVGRSLPSQLARLVRVLVLLLGEAAAIVGTYWTGKHATATLFQITSAGLGAGFISVLLPLILDPTLMRMPGVSGAGYRVRGQMGETVLEEKIRLRVNRRPPDE